MASYYMRNIVFSHAFHNVIAPHLKKFNFDRTIINPENVARHAQQEFLPASILKIDGERNSRTRRYYRTNLIVLVYIGQAIPPDTIPGNPTRNSNTQTLSKRSVTTITYSTYWRNTFLIGLKPAYSFHSMTWLKSKIHHGGSVPLWLVITWWILYSAILFSISTVYACLRPYTAGSPSDPTERIQTFVWIPSNNNLGAYLHHQ